MLRYVFGQGQSTFEGLSPNRRLIRSVGTLQDITPRKETEQRLRRLNSELEQFAYAAAHDLQEPLRNVCLATQLLVERYKGRFDETADLLLQTAASSPVRMQAMVKDLLAFSHVVRDTEGEMGAANSNAALSVALENLQRSSQEKGAQISFDQLPPVRMSESHLLQIFQNLISNSLKYCGDRRPCIHVSAVTQEGECAFFVKDNGLGIPPEFHDRAFLVFKRLHDRSLPGTGIGLALCKRIVEAYGGRIWIESTGNKEGTTVFFTPPIAS